MNYPNKTFIVEHTSEIFLGTRKHIILVVGKNKETAYQHLKDKLNFDGDINSLTWLMDTNHPTIYDQTGRTPLPVQAKIIYNTSINIKES